MKLGRWILSMTNSSQGENFVSLPSWIHFFGSLRLLIRASAIKEKMLCERLIGRAKYLAISNQFGWITGQSLSLAILICGRIKTMSFSTSLDQENQLSERACATGSSKRKRTRSSGHLMVSSEPNAEHTLVLKP